MQNKKKLYQKTIFLTLCSALLSVLSLGCGGGSRLPEGATGTVSGKITFEGKAAPEGSTITFLHKEKGFPATGQIADDGSYVLKMRGENGLLVGVYLVGISPPQAVLTLEEEKAIVNGGDGPPPKKWKEIPLKYRKAEKSGLTFEVKEGSNTYNLDMKVK